MNGLNSHIIKLSIGLVLWVFTGTVAWSQLQVQVGDTTTLSVENKAGETYTWELYDQYQGIDFATTAGNCPADKAVFVNGNTGHTINVNWLKAGTYLYKILVEDGCSNNLKMGMVIVTDTDKPPTPTIQVTYNCQNGTATLQASDYTGTLLWSTGETTDQITVNQSGIYTLIQTVDNISSASAEMTILDPTPPTNPDVSGMPAYIYMGETITLNAIGCDNGIIHWYSDKSLTRDITNLAVSPKEDTTYYAVCITNAGCESEASELVLIVKYDNRDCDRLFDNLNITNAISPNNDGKNDVWHLKDLEHYCSNCGKTAHVEIFDRWGDVVYQQDNYTNSNEKFEGLADSYKMYDNRKKLPSGTYFYIITIEGKKALTGWLYINNGND